MTEAEMLQKIADQEKSIHTQRQQIENLHSTLNDASLTLGTIVMLHKYGESGELKSWLDQYIARQVVIHVVTKSEGVH